jgi:hypothetical protein
MHTVTEKEKSADVPANGHVGVYATVDGTILFVTHHKGIKRTVVFTIEEWCSLAVGGIRLTASASEALKAQEEKAKAKAKG